MRQFIYDPDSKTPPPDGFEDLPDFAKDRPGLIGLPLPKKRVPATGWDNIYNYLILRRDGGDQSVGTLVVS